MAFGSGTDCSAPGGFACCVLGLADLLALGWAAFFISFRISLGRGERIFKIHQPFSDMGNEIRFKMSWPTNFKMQARDLMRDSIVMRSAHLVAEHNAHNLSKELRIL